MNKPNALVVFYSVVKSLVTTHTPRPSGSGELSHDQFTPILKSLETGGLPAAADWDLDLGAYLSYLSDVRPDELTRAEALAYWINLYNAGAVQLAIEAHSVGETSVLRIPGAFTRPVVSVSGEELSLDAIEHGKLRRFKDPRVHGALVCGSLSCPTLRSEPYTGRGLDDQLDAQMTAFLEGGGAVAGEPDEVLLSRILLWFGTDFVRPHRMPTFLPAAKGQVLEALRPWLPHRLADAERAGFQPYDWSLACSVG